MYKNEKVKEIMRLRETSLTDMRASRLALFTDFKNKRTILINDINSKRQNMVSTKDAGVVKLNRVKDNTISVMSNDKNSDIKNYDDMKNGYSASDLVLYKAHIEDITKNINIPISKKLGELGTLDIMNKYRINMKPPKKSIIFNYDKSICGANIIDGEVIYPEGYDKGIVNYDSGVFKNKNLLSGQMVDNGIWLGKGTRNLALYNVTTAKKTTLIDLGDRWKVIYPNFGNNGNDRFYLSPSIILDDEQVLSGEIYIYDINKMSSIRIQGDSFTDITCDAIKGINKFVLSGKTYNNSNVAEIHGTNIYNAYNKDNYVIFDKKIFIEKSQFPTPRVLTERQASVLKYDIYRGFSSFIMKLNRPYIEYDKVNLYSNERYILQVKKGIMPFFDREEDNVLIHDIKNSKLYINAVEVPSTLFRYIEKHTNLKHWISCTGWNETYIKDLASGDNIGFRHGANGRIKRVSNGIEMVKAIIDRINVDSINREFTILVSLSTIYTNDMASPVFYLFGNYNEIKDKAVSWSDAAINLSRNYTTATIRDILSNKIYSTNSICGDIYGVSYGLKNITYHSYQDNNSYNLDGLENINIGDADKLSIAIGSISDVYPSKYIIKDVRLYDRALTAAEMRAEIQLLEW